MEYSFSKLEFDKVFTSKQTLLNRFQKEGTLELIINYIPLFLDGEITGVVANFQKVNDLEDAANRVRYKKNEKQLKHHIHLILLSEIAKLYEKIKLLRRCSARQILQC